MFPGYVLVEMIMSDEAWYAVRNTPGVTGFIGSSGKGAKPIPLSPQEIDKINIYEASRKGMSEAIKRMKIKPDYILTDCMPLLEFNEIPQENLVKGDARAMSIAAASILAKVTRDDIMEELDKKYPEYHFAKHKGYPTKEHLEILEKLGPIESEYRYSYRPVAKFKYQKIQLF